MLPKVGTVALVARSNGISKPKMSDNAFPTFRNMSTPLHAQRTCKHIPANEGPWLISSSSANSSHAKKAAETTAKLNALSTDLTALVDALRTALEGRVDLIDQYNQRIMTQLTDNIESNRQTFSRLETANNDQRTDIRRLQDDVRDGKRLLEGVTSQATVSTTSSLVTSIRSDVAQTRKELKDFAESAALQLGSSQLLVQQNKLMMDLLNEKFDRLGIERSWDNETIDCTPCNTGSESLLYSGTLALLSITSAIIYKSPRTRQLLHRWMQAGLSDPILCLLLLLFAVNIARFVRTLLARVPALMPPGGDFVLFEGPWGEMSRVPFPCCEDPLVSVSVLTVVLKTDER